MKTKKKFTFKKGDVTDIDIISNMALFIATAADDKFWWEKTGADVDEYDFQGSDGGDEVIITRNIEITISINIGD